MIVLTSSGLTSGRRRAISATASGAGSRLSQAATSSSRRTICRRGPPSFSAAAGLPSPTIASTAPELAAIFCEISGGLLA